MIQKNEESSKPELRDLSHTKVSPTAYGIVYRLALADVGYAAKVYEELADIKSYQAAEEVALLEKMKAPELTPFFEARYKLVNRMLKDSGTNQVLEVAAGLSPRAIGMMAGNPEMKYAEVDLDKIVKEKQQIYNSLIAQRKTENSPNHHLEKGDALNLESLHRAVNYFDKQPIAVVNEGLMRYLTFDQKAQYARNVAALLKEYGGVWITPDITLKGMMLNAQQRTEQFSKDLGINIDANLFDDEAQARKFFEDLGFEIEAHPLREIESELVSPNKLNTSPEQMTDMLDKAVFYVMRLKR